MADREAVRLLTTIKRRSSFYMIIAEAGFTHEERKAIADLESLLLRS
jgi:hypothetical protein